ncbi:2-succinyl-5-enolpyruvyl-6-hydroxy-3-cyclohexene-1-carboxylic-acid synthase [Myxococcota bacterium]
MTPTASSDLTRWARLLADTLVRAGVGGAVLSPGSRSTAFAWALLEHPGLECRSVLDERSAGFFALGRAKMTGMPVVLLCTSGTAPSHYLPCVIEASCSCVPLIVLTADRPWELMDCEAPQTVSQTHLFGHHARAHVELGLPDSTPAALRGLRRRVLQAVLRSRWPRPGPVHLNLRARKPLEPMESGIPDSHGFCGKDEPAPTQVFLPRGAPDPQGIAVLATHCRNALRGLIVCGAALPWQAVNAQALGRLAEVTGFVVLAETTSQVRFADDTCFQLGTLCDGFEPLLRSFRFRETARPDCILQFGAPLLSRGWQELCQSTSGLARHAVADHVWPDPQNSLSTLTLGQPTRIAELLTEHLQGSAPSPARTAWRRHWAEANSLSWNVVNRWIGQDWSEGRAVSEVVRALPNGSVLAVGNSLPVREVDYFGQARSADIRVFSQRGANGIDGLLAGAAGAAWAACCPTVLLVGDLGFLHDVGGLAVAADLSVPLAIVVLNNRGGRIFSQLPVARSGAVAPYLQRHWTLSHDLNLTRVAQALGLRSFRVESADAVGLLLAQALARPGPTVLEVIVPPTSSESLAQVIQSELDRSLPPTA